jgi:hypothetical protein
VDLGDEVEGVGGGWGCLGSLALCSGGGDAVEVVHHLLGAGVVVPGDELGEGEIEARGEVAEGLAFKEETGEEVGEGVRVEGFDGLGEFGGDEGVGQTVRFCAYRRSTDVGADTAISGTGLYRWGVCRPVGALVHVGVNRGFRLPAFGGLRFTHGNGLAALRALWIGLKSPRGRGGRSAGCLSVLAALGVRGRERVGGIFISARFTVALACASGSLCGVFALCVGEEDGEAVLGVERWRDGGGCVVPGRHTTQYSPAALGCKWNLAQ